MSQSRWDGVTCARFSRMSTTFEGVPAEAALMLLSAQKPVYAGRGEQKLKIVDNGFLWLQIAPENGFWWLTAMYDENAGLIQFYFDITSGNHIDPDGECWFYDAFVDVIITPGSPARIVDEDELACALESGGISENIAAQAISNARNTALLYENCAQLEQYCDHLLHLMMET